MVMCMSENERVYDGLPARLANFAPGFSGCKGVIAWTVRDLVSGPGHIPMRIPLGLTTSRIAGLGEWIWAVQDSNIPAISAEKCGASIEPDAQSDARAAEIAEIIVRLRNLPGGRGRRSLEDNSAGQPTQLICF
jgi:hypothetical protein